MKRFYTTIEQSKKLSEFGLPLASADMFYRPTRDEYDNIDGYFNQPELMTDSAILFFRQCEYVPCWSVGALLDLFPRDKESPILNVTRGGYNIKGSYTRDWFVTLEDENSNIKFSEQAPELIDAVVNMVVQLKEKNLL